MPHREGRKNVDAGEDTLLLGKSRLVAYLMIDWYVIPSHYTDKLENTHTKRPTTINKVIV